jgi:hypothetical protein
MWNNTVQPDRPQMAIRGTRIACWLTKASNTHSEYVILVAFVLQQWLHERASILRLHVHCASRLLNSYSTVTKLGPRHMGSLGRASIWFHGQANNFTTLQTSILKIFQPRTEPGNTDGESCPNGV